MQLFRCQSELIQPGRLASDEMAGRHCLPVDRPLAARHVKGLVGKAAAPKHTAHFSIGDGSAAQRPNLQQSASNC